MVVAKFKQDLGAVVQGISRVVPLRVFSALPSLSGMLSSVLQGRLSVLFMAPVILLGCPVKDDGSSNFRKGGPVFFLQPMEDCVIDGTAVLCEKGVAACVSKGLVYMASEGRIVIRDERGGFVEDIEEESIPGVGCRVYLDLWRPTNSSSACDLYRQFACSSAVDDLAMEDLGGDESSLDLSLDSTFPLEACVREQAEAVGIDLELCSGFDPVDGRPGLECQIYRDMLERLGECISERGAQGLRDGYCFGIFRSPDFESLNLCEVCPWWSSRECFVMESGQYDGLE